MTTRIPLLSGAYQARSVIASAQRCVNLFMEQNPQNTEEPAPMTHYPTAGLDLQLTIPSGNVTRCTYRASNGNLYVVVNDTVYSISSALSVVNLGKVSNHTTPVYMADNGLVIVIVDGSTSGWAIDIASSQFGQIIDPTFVGSLRCDYVDTYFLFCAPGTNIWYISLSEVTFQMLTATPGSVLTGSIIDAGSGYVDGNYFSTSLTGGTGVGAAANIIVAGGVVTAVTIVNAGISYVAGDTLTSSIPGGSGFSYSVNTIGGYAFDPLDFATKNGYPDAIFGVIVMHREVWLIGETSTEVWANSGAADFTFQAIPGAFIDHGCASQYSIASQDLSVYWLSRDKQGHLIVLAGSFYTAKRISTNAIENEFATYSVFTDAIGFTYQQEGHTFYVIAFPSANKSWAYDISTELWHQWAWTDNNGNLNRSRANCMCFAYGKNIVGDWENGNIYALDLDATTDNGQPISRIRSFPHAMNNGNRMVYSRFVADMQCGTDDGSIDGSSAVNPPVVSLRISRNRGQSYGNYMQRSMGAAGEYMVFPQWRNLGMARDAVFELSWSTPTKTALNGAFVEVEMAET